MAEDTGTKAVSKYNVNYSKGVIQNFGGPIVPDTYFCM